MQSTHHWNTFWCHHSIGGMFDSLFTVHDVFAELEQNTSSSIILRVFFISVKHQHQTWYYCYRVHGIWQMEFIPQENMAVPSLCNKTTTITRLVMVILFMLPLLLCVFYGISCNGAYCYIYPNPPSAYWAINMTKGLQYGCVMTDIFL